MERSVTTTDSSFELLQALIRRHVDEISERIRKESRESVSLVEELQNQGNICVSSLDFVGGIWCYLIAVELLRLISEPSNEINLLLGTLLSNRAACYLKLEGQRSSRDFRKRILRNAELDCRMVMKSSWASRVLTKLIREELKFLHDKASARLDTLESLSTFVMCDGGEAEDELSLLQPSIQAGQISRIKATINDNQDVNNNL